jgi:hypothetical protein
MFSTTLDLDFQLPQVRPMEKPMAFTGTQLHKLISGKFAADAPPALQLIAQRVEDLRGGSITAAYGLVLGDLVTWSVRNARGSAPTLAAPLTYFKIEQHQWIPKVVIRTYSESQIDSTELRDYHITCRRGSIEFMCITQEQIADGYLDSKHFKRAFNGAFFCDRLKNATIFCPTLREWGFHSWDDAAQFEHRS